MNHWARTLVCLMGAGLLAATAYGVDQPFSVVKGQSKAANAGVLFKHGDFTVYKNLDAKTKDFDELYWANLEGLALPLFTLGSFGDVQHFQPRMFAIMKMKKEDVARMSSYLHHSGLACGVMVRLYGDTMVPVKRAPTPIISTDSQVAEVMSAHNIVDMNNIRDTVDELASIHTRYYRSQTGILVAGKLVEMYQAYAQDRDDVEIGTYEHSNRIPQDSLMVRIVGQSRPDEIIVLGSHIDSINSREGSRERAPGADDNASGTATNLEIFRVLMEQGIRLQRTLEIHGYAAEEVGLDGSQEIASSYRSDDKNVIAMVQHDMNIYSTNGQDKIWFVTNNTDRRLNDFLSNLVDRYQTVAKGTAVLRGGNSDHYSWTRVGYPAAFPFENPNQYNRAIHTRNDTVATAGQFSQAAEFAKLGVSFAVHFGGLATK